MDAIRVIYRIFPNKQIVKFLEKGKKKLEKDLNISDLAKKLNNCHNHFQNKENFNI
jgi:hypothetical protein